MKIKIVCSLKDDDSVRSGILTLKGTKNICFGTCSRDCPSCKENSLVVFVYDKSSEKNDKTLQEVVKNGSKTLVFHQKGFEVSRLVSECLYQYRLPPPICFISFDEQVVPIVQTLALI